MRRKSFFLIIIIITLAAFAFALARPGVILRNVDKLTNGSASDTNLPDEFDLKTIDFDIETDLDDENSIVVRPFEPTPQVEAATEDTSSTNRLIVPRMGVDADVVISDSQTALRQGLWHIPGSALPGENGNIVISAHRWLHKPPHPETFYLIDKMQVGDPIYYEYQGSRYTYRVTKTFVVDPEDVHILSRDESKLTLFTCTPLYSTSQRFVVNAELEAVDNL